MRNVIKLLLCAAILTGSTALAQDSVSHQRLAQRKLLAYRAARADAIRKLAERINGLNITSETTVADFVAESDTIETAMLAFLTGVREAGDPTYYEDGSCELTMEVTLETVIVNLKSIHDRYYHGDLLTVNDFDEMTVTNERAVLTETGMGVMPEEEGMIPVDSSTGSVDSRAYLRGRAAEFWDAHCTARGRLMAVRAARVEGIRRLAERIGGVVVDSETTVRDFVAESDYIDLATSTFLRGVRETRIRYMPNELIVEVEVEVTLQDVLVTIKSWLQRQQLGDTVMIERLEEAIVTTRERVIAETGMGVPPEQYLKNVTAELSAVIGMVASAPGWIHNTHRAVGVAAIDDTMANQAQARLMAFRAAELDARRKLAEELGGLLIRSNTTVHDFVAQNDTIRTRMLAFMQGARVLDETKTVLPDGSVEITVEIDLYPLWQLIIVNR